MPRPTSTHEQREAVRLLASTVGVREAARRLGLNENRVMQWSARYNWNQTDFNLVHNGENVVQDCKQIVSEAANSLLNYGRTTKMSLAKTVDKAATKFSDLDGEEIIAKSDRLVNVTNAASKIHQWETAGTTSALNLNVLSGGRAIVQVNSNDSQTNENQGSHPDTDV